MIYEVLPFQFDIEKLKKYFYEHVVQYKPTMQSTYFGGWSVLSVNGSYKDGWAPGHKIYDPSFMKGHSVEEKLNVIGDTPLQDYKYPTEICTGYLADVMKQIDEAGFNPRRARLSVVLAQGASELHRDALDHEYAIRLHVPIITNQGCTFHTEDESAHLPANGKAYVLRVNRMHQVFNRGVTDRLHLIMSVKDTKRITRFHQPPP